MHKALKLVRHLTDLADDPNTLEKAAEVIELADLKLFLKFKSVKLKKRVVNKIAGGVVTFGNAAPPIKIYSGPTGRRNTKGPATTDVTEPCAEDLPKPPKHVYSGGEGKSLGNVSRGERIRTSDPLLPKQVR